MSENAKTAVALFMFGAALALCGFLFGVTIEDGISDPAPSPYVTLQAADGYQYRVERTTGKVSEFRYGEWKEVGTFAIERPAPSQIDGVSLVEEWQAVDF